MTAKTEAAHRHPNYVLIYLALLALLAVSLLGPMLGILLVTIVTAFGVAVVKATMVAAYFMHLNIERRYVWYILLTMLVFMLVLFAGVAPDVMSHEGLNWKHIAEVQPPPAPHH